jgi:hypothetical protein
MTDPVQATLDGLTLGELLADQGMTATLNAAAQDRWRSDAYDWLGELRPGELVTSTDLVLAIGMPPSSNAVGAIMHAAAQARLIEATGDYVRSTRPSCHAAIVAVWRAL